MKLFVLLATFSTSLCLRTCPDGWSTFEGASKCYNIIIPNKSSSPLDYVNLCAREGATVASINNAFENEFLKNMANSARTFFGLFGTGFDAWANVDGSAVSYFEIDQIIFRTYRTHCFQKLMEINSDGAWNMPCVSSSLNGVFCQRGFSNPFKICPDGFVPFGETNATVRNCYAVGYNATWQHAHSACNARGAELAIIESSAENDFVTQLVSAHTYLFENQQVWLGGMFFGENWLWRNFKPMNYTNWGPGGENVSDLGLACLTLSADEQNNTTVEWQSKWFASDCMKSQRAYVCKTSSY